VVHKVYGPAYQGDPEYQTLVDRIEQVAGRLKAAPKIMVAKLGQDGHDRGAKVIASAFGDIGFDATAGPLFQTPDEAADLAVKNKVYVVGVSSLAAGHKTLAPQLIDALKAKGAEDIIVVVGGVVPRQDYQYLLDHGIAAVFGPGTNVLEPPARYST
jgi:methylmalonyl-CoA mutase